MNKIKKIAILILIIFLGITVTTVSNATFEVYSDVVDSIIKDHKFYPNTVLPGGTFFCIEPGAEFRPTLSSGENATYPAGSTLPTNGDYLCIECTPEIKLPWENGTKYYYRFTQSHTFSWHEHSDAAYVLAQMQEEGKVISWDTAYGIWNSTVSMGSRPGDYPIIGESHAYKDFYELIHGGATTNDIFESLIKDETKIIDRGVNQNEGSYTVGPFKIDYPDGVYDGKNKFSWIESIKAITDIGELPVQILSKTGAEININDLKENGSQTLDQKEFYVKFFTKEATKMKIEVELGYLEHCEATMTKYTGVKIYRNWAEEKSGTHDHPIVHSAQYDAFGNMIKDSWIEHDYKERRRYKAQDASFGEPQVLMAFSGTATKVRKKVKIEFPFHVEVYEPEEPGNPGNPPDDNYIPLTMKLAGNVFLDEQEGKANDENNLFDVGEGLDGIEVYLHQIKDGSDTIIDKTLTTGGGYYMFKDLNAQYKYYVEFVYNGMLYTNVEVGDLGTNANNISKAAEDAHGHGGNRQAFNSVFSEIGSNPLNYHSPSRGAYNQVFLQEDIANIFKSIANGYGSHGNSDQDVFAYDCRIHAYSEKNYPLIEIFTIDKKNNVIANENYDAIYDEQNTKYNQLHVNLGIKARPVFDLALYKDVFNATININGKQEVYTYDARKDWENKGFSYGVNEDYYIGQLRDKYMQNVDPSITTKEAIDEGQYMHEYRTEEIINGNNTNGTYKPWLQDNTNYEMTLYGSDYNPNGDNKYSWRDINHQLTDGEKLQIHVTYKIAIRNQSGVVGSATEIVDYYDSKYNFENAYVGDADGNRTGTVHTTNTSIYGEGSRTASANGTWNVQAADQQYSGEYKNTEHGYKTIYLQPDEQKLGDGETQYIYITFGLIDPEGTLIKAGLPWGEKFYTYNMAEINGYKTYGYKDKNITASEGIIDKDSNPGNFNPSTYSYGNELEDDTSRAPAYAYSIRKSRTLEGNVFEDMLSNNATASEYKNDEYKVVANKTRFGDGTINAPNATDKMIAGIKVELVEIKNGNLYVRQTTKTNSDGWYGFGAFIPGNYTIRFTYGADNDTALTTNSQYSQGLNDTSYNGQDYQSTIFTPSANEVSNTQTYVTDETLKNTYNSNNNNKGNEESKVNVANAQNIKKYQNANYYWYADTSIGSKSDAYDDEARRNEVVAYSKGEYGREITNHKAEVFNSYINQAKLREDEGNRNFNQFTQAQPMGEGVDNETKNKALVSELERRTYMYAYTPEIPVEVEYTTTQITGNQASDYYTHKIMGVDFGVVERPRANLTIDQDIEYIKVTASNGDTLLELQYDELEKHYKVIVDNENNYQWVEKEQQNDTFEGYDKNELLNIIMDDELLSGSKLEVRYRFTVTNNSEVCTNIANTLNTGNTSRAKNIINYVANNLNFDASDNNELWEVVNKDDIQKASNSTWINNDVRSNNTKVVDLSTQTTILKATDKNTLTKQLKPGESATEILTLKKILSSESSSDDLKYTNMAEIVEVESELGRYDHGAIPGNQRIEEQPREHDTSGASRYDEMANSPYDPDGKIIITPPTGESKIYYVLAAGVAVITLAGVVLIKKFVIGGRK